MWPGEQFLDYDQGINVAVNRLRIALREGSRPSHFLKTIPKRGYSFCAQVTLVPAEIPGTAVSPAISASLLGGAPVGAGRERELDLIISDLAPIHEGNGAPAIWSQANAYSSTPHPAITDVREIASLIPHEFVSTAPAAADAINRRGVLRRIWLRIAVVLVGVAVVCGAWPVYTRLRAVPAIPVVRLGITPLHVQGDAQTAAVGASFRLELSDAFSRLPGVQVPALEAFPTSNAIDIPKISRELNLQELLLGSIAQQGDQYDLKFELVRASDATHLAYFEYSGPRKDLPAICERLQQDIFHYLQSKTTVLQTSKGSTNDPHAYEFYLRGEYDLLERDQAAFKQALGEFQQAISRDPNFAAAYAGAATAYLKLANYDTDPRHGLLAKAEEYAAESVKLDPSLPGGHAVLGTTAYKLDRDFPRGEAELRNAIRIDPTQAAPRDLLAVLLVERGRFDEALQQLETARTSAPTGPSVYAMEGLVGVYARRDAFAISAARQYVDMLPNLPIAHNTMAWVDFETGHYKDAIDEWRQMAVLQNDHARVALEDKGMEALKHGGVKGYARLRLAAIADKKGSGQVNDFMPAEWYACAGNREQTLVELDRLATANDSFMLHVGVDPLFDSLHHDPQFLAILSKAGISVPASLVNVNSHICE